MTDSSRRARRSTVLFDTSSGRIVGEAVGDTVRVRGIRYARAARFAAPSPEAAATEPVSGLAPSPQCPQTPSDTLDAVFPGGGGVVESSEDCLRLSVTAPRVCDGMQPVMVFIHGGSYVNGAGDLPAYDPRRLVEEQRVVVVSVQYRLGLFGFLGDTEDPGQRRANLALLDLIEGLRWIHANITAFGGDPGNVTVFGHSAGGDAITYLMISAGTRGLFHRAIIQSAPLGIPRDRAVMHRSMVHSVTHLDGNSSVEDILHCQTSLQADASLFGPVNGALPLSPQLGAHPLPAVASAASAWRAVAPSIDVLIGSTTREAALFLDEVRAAVPVIPRIERVPIIGPAVTAIVVAACQRLLYDRGIARFASQHRRGGGRVIRYSLNWRQPGNPLSGAHCTELPLLLGDDAAWHGSPLIAGSAWCDVDDKGRVLRQIWADFARTGSPPRDVDGLLHLRRC